MSKQNKYGLDNFISIADGYVNADTTSVDGIEKAMIAWYIFKFETTPNDPKLLDMTLEEILVLYHMHKIRDNPAIIEDTGNTPESGDDWEDWLQDEMGEEYEDQDQMIATMDKEATQYTQKVREQFGELPDKIDTDFSMLDEEDNG